MGNLRFDYELLLELRSALQNVQLEFEIMAGGACPSASSNDPVADHHALSVKPQEGRLLEETVGSFKNAQDGVAAAYDAFKAADQAGAQ